MLLRRFALLACVVYTLHTSAAAQSCPGGRCPLPPAAGVGATQRATPHPAVVRIRNVDAHGGASIGSGALVGRNTAGDGVVLTAWHLFREGVGQVYVDFPAGAHRMGTVAQLERTDDLAAVLVADPPPVELTISDSDMVKGTPIAFAGYGSDGIYRLQSGTVIERASFDAGATWAARAWTGQARSGDSGGPAFDARGQVCGVVSAARSGQTVGTCGPQVRQFLDGVCVPAPANGVPGSKPLPPPPAKDVNSTPQKLPNTGDMKAVRDEIAALRTLLTRLRGCNCPAPQPAAKCPCDLAGLEQRLVAQLRTSVPKPVTHLVVVADRKAPTWPRLAEEIHAAQQSYHRIVVSDLPPFSIGPVPQLVEYEAGKAKHVFKGERDVAAQLARIRRGEYPQ